MVATILAALATACAGSSDPPGALDATGALLPDTATVDGVLVMRHGADAFERAAQWSLDTVPQLTIDGGEKFDLSAVYGDVTLLADGRSVVMRSMGGGELILFDAAGAPSRLLARQGEGPGELLEPLAVVLLGADTLVVADASTRRINWFTPDGGLIQSLPAGQSFTGRCLRPAGMLPGRRMIAVGACSSNRRLPDGTLRAETPLVSYGLDFADADTLAMVRGSRMTMIEVEQGGQRFPAMSWVQLAQPTTVAVIDSTIVLGAGDGGYVIDLLHASGVARARIVVERPAQLVNDDLRQRVIDRAIVQRGGASATGAQLEAIRRQVMLEPVADTVAAYQRLLASPSGTVWVIDFPLPGDSTWAATGFRRDGAIVGRISAARTLGDPIWFGDERVILRQEDEDGLVRFGVYRMMASTAGLSRPGGS
jgi:hypothetical protein